MAMHALMPASKPGFAAAMLQSVRWALPYLMLSTIAVGLAAFVAQSWITPQFLAEARLEVAGAPTREKAVAEHISQLSEPERIFSIAKEFNLERLPEFSGAGRNSGLLTQLGFGPRQPEPNLNADERLMVQVLRRLEIAPGKDASTVAVRMTASDPNVAAQFVNRLVGVHMKDLPAEMAPAMVRQWAEAAPWAIYPRKGVTAIVGMSVMLGLGLSLLAMREAVRYLRRRRNGSAGIDSQPSRTGAAARGATRFARMDNASAVAAQLLKLSTVSHGFRTIVAADMPGVDASGEALRLAIELSRAGRQVILIHWNLAGGGMFDSRIRSDVAGFNDLMQGTATFEAVITRLPDCRVHGIAAGAPAVDVTAALDPDRLNMVLDALDEVYDHIIVMASHSEARALFAALEGRFDACVSLTDGRGGEKVLAASPDLFLGFEVTDIDIVELVRPMQIPAHRMAVARVA
jgi:hypothetical protein